MSRKEGITNVRKGSDLEAGAKGTWRGKRSDSRGGSDLQGR